MRRTQKSADATTHGEVNNGYHYIREMVYAEDTKKGTDATLAR
jgi:hypothetical protein